MCRINIRPEYKGMPMQPGIEVLNGKVIPLRVLWQCDDDELYAGEWALGSADRQASGIGGYPMSWIPSGDVEVIEPQPMIDERGE